MSELVTVTLTTEEIFEVLQVATRDGVRICDKSEKFLCERNDGYCLLFQAAVAGLAEFCSCARRFWIRAAVWASWNGLERTTLPRESVAAM